MFASCKINGLWIYIFLLFAYVDSKSSILNLKSKPLVFGENLQLSCDGSACEPNTIKKWIGGPSYKLLCYDGYSVDYSKYAIMVTDTIANFSMMIKHIAVEDTFWRYTCACGLHQYTEMLDLEGVDYIYPPDIHYNSTMTRDGKYQIEIQLEVYPLPKCFVTYERNVLPVNITNSLTKHFYRGGNMKLHDVRIIHTIDVHRYKCKGKLILTCNVGTRHYTLIHQNIDVCKVSANMHMDIDTTDNVLFPLIIIVAFVSVVAIICLISNRCRRYHGNQPQGGNTLLNQTTL